MSLASLKGFDDPLGHHSGLNGLHVVLDFRIGELNGSVTLDISDIAISHDIGRHLSFEFTFAPEHHHRNELFWGDPKEFLEHLDVPVILVHWVLEAEFFPEQALCPLSTFGIPENPPIHVLRFNDEDPEFGNDDMIDLGGAIAGLDRDIVETDVCLFVEQQLLGEGTGSFADPTFDK